MLSGDPRVEVRPLVKMIKDMILLSQRQDAIHTPIWAAPTNCLSVFLALPKRLTFATPQSRFFMNVEFKYLLSLLQLPISITFASIIEVFMNVKFKHLLSLLQLPISITFASL